MGKDLRKQSFETLAIHAGQEPELQTGAVVVPIFQTSTFAQEAVGKDKGFDYARTANPTRTALQSCLAALESGAWGLAFASGMAAEDAIAHLLNTGDHVVMGDDVYGERINKVFSKKYGSLNRYFLHASYLRFTHPGTRVELEFHSPLPSELQNFVNRLR